MDTDLVLDLFRRTTEEEDAAAKKKTKESSGPVTQKNILNGLEDLPRGGRVSGLGSFDFHGFYRKMSLLGSKTIVVHIIIILFVLQCVCFPG